MRKLQSRERPCTTEKSSIRKTDLRKNKREAPKTTRNASNE